MRQTILEIVLELLTDSGVDDVHLIIANALHRRMTEAEMKRMVGSKIFDAYYPERYYNHDAEDPDGMVELERTSHGEVVAINRRAAESDLLIYVNINLVPMDGGHKSVGTGLANYAVAAGAPQPEDHPRVRELHGAEPERAPQEHRAHRPGDRQEAQGLPHRDRAEQPDVRRPDRVPRRRARRTTPSSTG